VAANDERLGTLAENKMDEALRSKILEVLRRHHTMTLATIRPDGYPHATTVNYIYDDLTLYFATDATSQKAGNIKRATGIGHARLIIDLLDVLV
jgi:nitroimidazol reductase NimA-like FMN-containing flavoprotein (pyridoxamine 5'-phosphate oxidase superfamily)